MAKPRKIPWSVREAQKAGNYDTLRSLAIFGNIVKSEMAAKDKELEKRKKRREKEAERRLVEKRRKWWSNSSMQMARQANEHICPID